MTRVGAALGAMLLTLGLIGSEGTAWAQGDEPYPPQAQWAFMAGCQGHGGTYAYCDCVLTWLERYVPFTEALADAKIYESGGGLPPAMWRASATCASYYQ